MTIAVDFDGTIVEDRYPKIGKPVPYAFETLLSLQKKGHRIILWTAREGECLKEAVEFCRSAGLEFYAVNSETPSAWADAAPSTRKIVADVYIDDRAVAGLPEWPVIGKIICGEMVEWSGEASSRLKSPESHSSGRASCSGKWPSRQRKRNIFKRIADRCRRSRERFG